MTVKTENHIHCTIRIFHDQVHYKFLVVPFASCSVLNTIQGLKGSWEGGGEVASHPRKLKPTTISGGNDSDLPKVLLLPLPDVRFRFMFL